MISAEGSTLSIDFAAFACLPVCHAQPCCLAPETPRRRPLEAALSPEQGARDARQMKTRAASFSNLSRPVASEATTGAFLKNARQSRPLTALLEYTELQSSAQSPITPEQAAVDRVREICGTDTFGPTEAELLAIHIVKMSPLLRREVVRHCPDAYRPKLVGAVKDFYAQLQKKTYQQRCDYFLAKGIGSAEQDQMWSLKSDLLNFEFMMKSYSNRVQRFGHSQDAKQNARKLSHGHKRCHNHHSR